MKSRKPLFAVTLVLLGGLAWRFRPELTQFVYLGPPLMHVDTPTADTEVPVGVVDVMVEFAEGDRVAPETFEVSLNGLDVTDNLTVGRNGVAGQVVGLREGDNHIRLRVFGRSLWNGHFVDEEREVVVHVRSLPFLDLA